MSQNTDTLVGPFPLRQMRKIIKDNENGKVAKKELEVTKNSLHIANQALGLKDTIIETFKEKVGFREDQLHAYTRGLDIMQRKDSLNLVWVTKLNTEVIRQQRKKQFYQKTTGILLIISLIESAILFITK